LVASNSWCRRARRTSGLDVAALTFCDATRLSALLPAKRICGDAGGSFAVLGGAGGMATILKITGLGQALKGQKDT
jgi:hypothetical protein